MSARPVFAIAELRRGHERIQAGNLYYRGAGLAAMVQYALAGYGQGAKLALWPWRVPTVPVLDTTSTTMVLTNNEYGSQGGSRIAWPTVNTALATQDTGRYRRYGGFNLGAGDTPRVVGAMLLSIADQNLGAVYLPGTFAMIDVPITQVGPVYLHPTCVSVNSTFTAGQSYLTGLSTATWHGFFGILSSRGANYCRVLSGASKGVYRVRHYDGTRVWLTNLDGTAFTAGASETVATWFGPGLAYFNQAGIIPNSTGVVAADGVYAPGAARNSYLFRLMFEKSGSPSPTDPNQQGSYWFTIRPYCYGDGSEWNGGDQQTETLGMPMSQMVFGWGTNPTALSTYFNDHAFLTGSALALGSQRFWFTIRDDNGTASGIYYWNFKTPEAPHEVAHNMGVAVAPLAGITWGSGCVATSLTHGSDDSMYVSLYGTANAGVVQIKDDLTVTQWLSSSAGLGANLVGVAADRSRARTGAAGDVTTTAGAGTLTSASGAFSAADLGRVVKLTGGPDAGLYLISVVTDATHITVKTLAGAAVTFTGGAGGTFQIGDRIYLFWNDTTSTPNVLTYMESLAFGTPLTTAALGMTDGAQTWTQGATGRGIGPVVAVDPISGVVYWYTSDTAYQVNRYDPATGAWARRLLTGDLNQAPAGGVNHTAPTVITALAVNTHASFRELWIGTDRGFLKLDATNFAAAFARYYGNGDPTSYQNPNGMPRPHGAVRSGLLSIQSIRFGPDGRVYAYVGPDATNGTPASSEAVQYVREHDAWGTLETVYQGNNGAGGEALRGVTSNSTIWAIRNGFYVSPWGDVIVLTPYNGSGASILYYTVPIDYQWIGGAWVAKEVVRGALPDATSSPGCSCKPMHTTLDDLIYGVKVKFTPQGGATPANNEFIGRVGIRDAGGGKTDGATTLGSATFGGSGFVAADVGRYLRIESGADQGVYRVATYVNANQVTLAKENPGTAWTATANAATLNYSVWDFGAYGPESATLLASNGFGKDNTQDLTGITADWFVAKTVLSEQAEAVKFALPYIGPAGSAGARLWSEVWGNTNPNYPVNTPQTQALPGGAATAGGYQALLGMLGLYADGSNGRVNMQTTGNWGGRSASSAPGHFVTVDFGADVEVGALMARWHPTGTPSGWADPNSYLNTKYGYGGAIINVHKAAEAGGAPAAGSVVRLSGTGFSLATNALRSTGTADFIGAITGGPNVDGTTVQGQNTFAAAAGTFTGGVGWVLRVTSGADQGYYRVTAVNGDGSQATIRNIDQTAKAWSASAAGLSYTLHANAVRAEDTIYVPNLATATHRITVERLYTPTTADVRLSPNATLTNVTWDAVKPSWDLVKRVSPATTAQPPEVAGNGTFMSDDGREAYAGSTSPVTAGSAKAVLDLSDLTTAQRTGRYWRISLMPRFGNAAGGYPLFAFEAYDPTGKRVDLLPDQKLDTAETPNFLACNVIRAEWIQATDTAASHVAGTNGLATIGGALGDTVTCAGGKFLGYEVRRGAVGSSAGGNAFANGGADPGFVASDVGRFLNITSGANAGVVARIATVPTGTSLTLVTPAGNPITLAADAGPSTYSIHEGIAVGATLYDVIRIAGNDYPIAAISDDLTTLTLGVHTFLALAGQTWEIRRRAYQSAATGVDTSYVARILDPALAWAQQSGDFVIDYRGILGFYPADVNAVQRADGAIAGGDGTFVGTAFSPDDVGRVLIVTTGANRGHYRVSAFTNATTITLANARTGAAVTLAADVGPITYQMAGERRYRLSRYVSVYRQ